MAELKKVDYNIRKSFNKVKDEIFQLKKDKKEILKRLNQLTLEQVKITSLGATKEEIHELEMDVDILRNSQDLISDLPEDVLKLKKETVTKKELEKLSLKQDVSFYKLNEELKKLKETKDEVKMNKIREIESKIIPLEEIRTTILDDVHRKYSTTEEVTKQVDQLKKEVNKMTESFIKIRKNVIVFPRLKIFSNMFLLLSLISLSGAAISIYLKYVQSANFLAVEGATFLVLGLLIKVIALLRE